VELAAVRAMSIGGTYGECGVVVGQVWGFVDVRRGVLEQGLVTELYLDSIITYQVWKTLVFPVVGHVSLNFEYRFNIYAQISVSGDAAETQAATRLLPSLI
jgi:hypothetical protein